MEKRIVLCIILDVPKSSRGQLNSAPPLFLSVFVQEDWVVLQLAPPIIEIESFCGDADTKCAVKN